jgi:hypothetical protein
MLSSIVDNMRIIPVFKRHSIPDIPPYYLRLARHWRMGAQSSDLIRQRLMQRGISWEKTLEIISFLDHEDSEAGKLSLSRRGPDSDSWLTSYSVLVVFGLVSLFLNSLFNHPTLRCDLAGFGLLGIGLVGVAMYGINALVIRLL